MRPRIAVVEHDVDCPPGLLGTWLVEAGAELDVRRPYAGDPLPVLRDPAHPEGADALLVLGGPMDAWDDDGHPWLSPTRDLIRCASDLGRPTLGVCLGHQLCALAFDGTVGRSPRGQQVGLTPIQWQDHASGDPLLGADARAETPARGVHWNDDLVLELPPSARELARTPAGDLQAARFADTVWGVQWHPEVDRTLVAPWAAGDAARHAESGLDQGAALLRIDEAAGELEHTWRILATSMVALLTAEVA